ncbi:MAG: metal ABC transporter permease [Clostridiales bacterium]|jgi:zinc transport system permease protein|nr:metal ABC transporter permease [Clostridiales bacterium]
MSVWEYLQFSFVQNALIVGVLVALCAALIGVPLVLKRYSFIGDGLSHIAFGGMAVAAVINLTNNLYLIMPLTVAAAVSLLTAGQNAKIKGDAAIALISVAALAFGYFLLNTFSVTPNISADVCTSLFGSTSILTLKQSDIFLCIGMSVLVIAVYLVFYNKIFAVTFDAEFMKAAGVKSKAYEILVAAVIGIVVSLSMRLVGSLLTSALVIFPALSAMRVFKNFKAVVLCSAAVSVACALCGILISIVWGTPVGATIVLTEVVIFGLFCVSGLKFKRR